MLGWDNTRIGILMRLERTSIFSVGDIVLLVELVSNPSLNGAIGIVMGNFDESRSRYAIKLQSPAAAVAAHPS
jgi:hypothetical protein